MDLKKLKKSSSKKFMKGSLGFFLSPRDDGKEGSQGALSGSKDAPVMTHFRKTNEWGSDGFKLDRSNNAEESDKDFFDDIPVIPSIDDFQDDMTSQIAKAPMIGVKQLATYKELENDILKHSAFSSLDEVNLQVLIKGLHPDSLINEPDIPWTRESLFYELVSKVNERKT